MIGFVMMAAVHGTDKHPSPRDDGQVDLADGQKRRPYYERGFDATASLDPLIASSYHVADDHAALRRTGSLDASPRAECVLDNLARNGSFERRRRYKDTNVVNFDDLVGPSSDPSTAFTCERQHPDALPPAAYPYRWPLGDEQPRCAHHARTDRSERSWNQPQRPSHRPFSLEDVGIGMPVAGQWVTAMPNASRAAARASLNDLCVSGDTLACNRITWMAAAGRRLEVLLLADTCTPCMYTHVHPHVYGTCMACTGAAPGGLRPAVQGREPPRARPSALRAERRGHVELAQHDGVPLPAEGLAPQRAAQPRDALPAVCFWGWSSLQSPG